MGTRDRCIKTGFVVIVFLLVIMFCFNFEFPTEYGNKVTNHDLVTSKKVDYNDFVTSPRELLQNESITATMRTENLSQPSNLYEPVIPPVKPVIVPKPVNSPASTNLPQQPVNLPQSVIDGVKTLVFFLGHPRSGHSIVGSLLDSHPHMVIADELNLFSRLSSRSLAREKNTVFNALWRSTRESIIRGLRTRGTRGKGYSLFVDGLYQGKYVDHIDVIGDKKGGETTGLLLDNPNGWSNILNFLNSLTNSVKVIQVIRNPYDNIATMILYIYKPMKAIGSIKQSGETFNFESGVVEKSIKQYFSYYQSIEDAKKTYSLNMIEIHNRDLINDSRGTLLKTCNYLGVTCSDHYLEICSNKVFKTESRTRHLIEWNSEQLEMIQQNIRKYSSLEGYTFDSQ